MVPGRPGSLRGGPAAPVASRRPALAGRGSVARPQRAADISWSHGVGVGVGVGVAELVDAAALEEATTPGIVTTMTVGRGAVALAGVVVVAVCAGAAAAGAARWETVGAAVGAAVAGVVFTAGSDTVGAGAGRRST